MMQTNKYLAEFLGTLLLLLSILASGGNFAVVGAALAVAIFFAGGISGGHVNPAVSLAMYVKGGLSKVDLLGYVLAQCAGAVSSLYLYKTFA
jgi:aquaporin Z